MKRFVGGFIFLFSLITLIIMIFPGVLFIFYVSDQPSSSDGLRQLTTLTAWISTVTILFFLLKKNWKIFKGLDAEDYKPNIAVKIAGAILGFMILYYLITSIPIMIALMGGPGSDFVY